MKLPKLHLRDLFWLGISVSLIGVAWVMLYRAGAFNEVVEYVVANFS